MKSKFLPKFTVTIITYNQEKLISRALDSILIQKEWVYEIVVCDDCSTDNNWDVIMDYYSKYPDLIRPFRNDPNLGIYGNIERTWKESRGELILEMSGDDTIENGIFEKAYNLIREKEIEYKNKAISIFCDFQIKDPNGFVRKGPSNNMLLNKKLNPVSLKLRGLVYNRTSFSSMPLLKKYKPVPRDIGHFCDELVDIQRILFSEEIYYFDFIGSTYFSGVGVSVNHKREEYLKSMKKTADILKHDFNFHAKDIRFIDYQTYYRDFIFDRQNLKNFILTIKFYILSLDFRYGLRGIRIKDPLYLLFKYIKFFFSLNII